MWDRSPMRGLVAAAWVSLGVASLSRAETQPVEEQVSLARVVSPSLVVVEYWLGYDENGLAPGESITGGESGIPFNSGSYQYAGYIEERRPLEASGYLIGATRVVTRDSSIHPRFVREVRVRQGDQSVGATIAGVGLDRRALLLELEGPLANSVPLSFTGEVGAEMQRVELQEVNGEWVLTQFEYEPIVSRAPDEKEFVWIHPGLYVDRSGRAIGLIFTNHVPTDGSWGGTPEDWQWLAGETATRELSEMEGTIRGVVLRTTIHLRSPESNDESGGMFGRIVRFSGFPGMEEDVSGTETHATAILMEGQRALVLADLSVEATSRIEVFGPEGDAVEGRYVSALKDFGAIVVALEEPMGEAAVFSGESREAIEDHLLFGVVAMSAGQEQILRLAYDRVHSWGRGFRHRYYPSTVAGHRLLFDRDARLVAVPFQRREHPSETSRWRSAETLAMPAAQLGEILSSLEEHSDPSRRPRSEQESRSIAWLGVVLQPIDRELARVNGVAELTRDGRVGAIVTYVYEGSPAERAGIGAGSILLRVRVKDDPKPIAVTVEEGETAFEMFPAELLEEMPAEYLSEMPPPWPSASDGFTDLLTRLGIGTSYTLELIADGRIVSQEHVVSAAPLHFDAAPRFKSDRLGVTVRQVTFEVRRHLRMKADDPGVVISKVEPGSRAFIAGLRPYEIVTHLNGEPVNDVEAFERVTAEEAPIQMTVKRMDRTRQVRME